MTHQIKLTNVDLDYFVYSLRSQSLRSAVFNLAVGGRMYKAAGDVAAVKALHDINLEINEGDRIALVGHNGSGKTTLLKVIAGIYSPTRGELSIDGDITSMIAINAGLDMEATGLRNIHKLGLMRRLSRKVIDSRVDAIAEFSGLGDFLHLPVRTYSAGMLARLMFTVATEFEADILVLDEWLSAGDAAFVQKAAQRMHRMVEDAKIMVMATHDHDLVQRVCNRVCELQGGKIAFLGSTEDWLAYRETQAA
ncbi:ABC transporter ATP-binding protein [Caulobacter vibrioides]|uniref:ABC transporter ATP-binding protein n=1 Tax=Caulobacter vibrioides TaxID=155892 RepID=A0A290MT08_CAUVI|nr:ABC transporter ATP-binding protein [Caulobacter vibrioides]ATC23604.1 ABC transporter ATP-binding protein [Caulobacter vibrioides]ATC32982.1 ABC transporter ATP-binding protein [Caulobacter vibrioides]AZH11855.1 ABC transporter ATP-binding protein [Caulobacter vibrioides]PLR11803.1 sugar ABC transporter ATP-binding protein [Caulobacter vibrioides]